MDDDMVYSDNFLRLAMEAAPRRENSIHEALKAGINGLTNRGKRSAVLKRALRSHEWHGEARGNDTCDFVHITTSKGTLSLKQHQRSVDAADHGGQLGRFPCSQCTSIPSKHTLCCLIVQISPYSLSSSPSLTQSLPYLIGTGALVWDCARVMIRWLETQKNDLNRPHHTPRHILELGSGTGAVGLSVMALGLAERVTLTDIKALLELLEDNADRNADAFGYCRDRVAVADLSWGDTLPEGGPYDLILACDCVVPIFPMEPLVEQIDALLRQGASQAIICYEDRDAGACCGRFRFLCGQRAMEVVEVGRDELRGAVNAPEDIHIVRLWRVM